MTTEQQQTSRDAFQAALVKATPSEVVSMRRAIQREDFKQRLGEALPDKSTIGRMISAVDFSLDKDPGIARCEPGSIILSLRRAALYGLVPDGVEGHLAHYKGKCQFLADYKGLIKLAKREGAIVTIEAEPVYRGEPFDHEHTHEGTKFNHKQTLGCGDLIYAWARALLPGGAMQSRIMTRAQIDHIREKSTSPKSPAWRDHYGEMARKTVVKNLLKYLPEAGEAHRLAIEDDAIELGYTARVEG